MLRNVVGLGWFGKGSSGHWYTITDSCYSGMGKSSSKQEATSGPEYSVGLNGKSDKLFKISYYCSKRYLGKRKSNNSFVSPTQDRTESNARKGKRTSVLSEG